MKIKHRTFLTFGILFIGLCLHSCQSDLKFESEEWKNNGGENITLDIRFRMVNDLIENEILLKKNETEIKELIGISEKLRDKNDIKLKYYPVTEKYEWGDIDPKELIYLEIRFDDKGLSDSVKLITTR